MRQKRREAPEWIFPWKPRREPWTPKVVALASSLALFGWLVGFVRMETATPNPWGLDHASVIHGSDTPEGRALALRARENGPTPVRFQTGDWPQLLRTENREFARAAQIHSPYQPRFQAWEPAPATIPPLSEPGTGVLPPPPERPAPAPPPPGGALRPVIQPLAGLRPHEVPDELPPYSGTIDAAMMSDSVRFLLRLSRDGRVLDSIALSGGDTPEATTQLIDWLQGVRLRRTTPDHPATPDHAEWVAIRILFLNRPR